MRSQTDFRRGEADHELLRRLGRTGKGAGHEGKAGRVLQGLLRQGKSGVRGRALATRRADNPARSPRCPTVSRWTGRPLPPSSTASTQPEKGYDVKNVKGNSKIVLDADFEKLYYNMLEAKADWLCTLEQWDGVLSPDERAERSSAGGNGAGSRSAKRSDATSRAPAGAERNTRNAVVLNPMASLRLAIGIFNGVKRANAASFALVFLSVETALPRRSKFRFAHASSRIAHPLAYTQSVKARSSSLLLSPQSFALRGCSLCAARVGDSSHPLPRPGQTTFAHAPPLRCARGGFSRPAPLLLSS